MRATRCLAVDLAVTPHDGLSAFLDGLVDLVSVGRLPCLGLLASPRASEESEHHPADEKDDVRDEQRSFHLCRSDDHCDQEPDAHREEHVVDRTHHGLHLGTRANGSDGTELDVHEILIGVSTCHFCLLSS